MGLSDVAGVFSRYFVIGFFVPSFVVLLGTSQLLPHDSLPSVYLEAGNGARVAIIGGASLLVGLVLLGLNYPILRLFEGQTLGRHWYTKPLYVPLVWRQKRRRKKAKAEITAASAGSVEANNATWRLGRKFRLDDEIVLPTSLGNAIRAFEGYSAIRWGLNGIAAWPRIEMLLSTQEQEVLADAKGNVAFFVNGALLIALGGAALIVDRIVENAISFPSGLAYAAAFVLSGLFNRAAVGAAVSWGSVVSASIDLHRREIYEKVGLRMPSSFSDERDELAPALNAVLLRGEEIPDRFAATPTVGDSGAQAVT
jgi:hypothetical protein